jgi:hypothetical protein
VHLKDGINHINVYLQRVPQFVIFSVVNKIFENKFNMYIRTNMYIATMHNKITLLGLTLILFVLLYLAAARSKIIACQSRPPRKTG